MRIQDSALIAAATLSRPLHRRPLPARQGDRPDRRGGVAAEDRDRLAADRDRRGRAPRDAAGDRADVAEQGERRGVARAPRGDRAELAELQERSSAMKAQWQNEKDAIEESPSSRSDSRGAGGGRARRARGGPQRAAELRYGEIPTSNASSLRQRRAERASEDATARKPRPSRSQRGDRRRGHRRGRRELDRHPRQAVLEAENEKLVHMEERLHERVIGQDEAVRRSPRAVRRARAGLQDPDRPIGSFLVFGPDRRRQDRARARAGGVPVRRRGRDDPHRHVRVHGETHGLAPGRRAARLRRLRRGRTADRGGAAPALLVSCSTRSRRRTPTSSTSCCRCSTTAA